MLSLRPNCECCAKALPPSSKEALICSFECTFCTSCNDEILKGCCPNCGGNLVKRPIRPEKHLIKNTASTEVIVKDEACEAVL